MKETPGFVPETWLHIAAAVIVGVAGIGFLTGTHEESYDFQAIDLTAAPVPVGEVPSARPYWDMPKTPRGKGSGFDGNLTALAALSPELTDPVLLDGTDKPAALVDRAARRAYDGAPPTIPHPIRQDAAPECLACHETGLVLRGRTAPAMSHKAYTSCTQCHVVSETPMPGGADLVVDPRSPNNTFEGLDAPLAGPRWTGIAPPQLPHRTWMRENCDSCHGPNGRAAIRSSHPYRQSCVQCHTASEGTAR